MHARRLATLLAAASLAALAAGAGLPHGAAAAPRAEPPSALAQPPTLPGAPTCGPSTASPGEPQNGRNDTGTRYASPIYFPSDFPVFADSDVNTTLGAVGGFGGIRFRGPLHHTPVVFVHGNQADAQNWLDVMQQFAGQAGYSMQEMYALSYNGLGNYYAGAPEQLPPTQLDQDYIAQNSNGLANGGHGAANDDNVPDLCRFVEEVQWYTGSRQVDIVAHSLGVTLARRLMVLYPSLAHDVTAFVGIAGGNHGTTVCRGLDTSYYGCDEIAPGTDWLRELNKHGETYGATRWMTVYDGAEGDPFFVGPDEPSPHLTGADNRTFNANTVGAPDGRGDYHNDLRVDPPEVETYLAWVLRNGQSGPGAAHGVDALAARIAAQGAADQAANQQSPGVYYPLAGAALCIPLLTGNQDGCTLSGDSGGTAPLHDASSSSGGGGNGSGAPAAAALPNTAAAPGAAIPASALALVAGGALRRRMRARARHRMPVS